MGSRNRFNTSGNKKTAPSSGPQSNNPFGQNFAPFYIPDTAPIRGIIGPRPQSEINAPPSTNPLDPNFQPFYIPDNAPVRGVIGPRPSNSGEYYGPGGNPSGSGQGQAQQSPGMGPFQGHGTVDVPRPSQPTGEPAMGGSNGRNEEKMNALGVPQTGTNMNRSFNDLLNTVAGGRFLSEQLPTTAGSPDTNIGPVANGQEYANNLGRQGTKGIGPVADGQVYGNVLENAPNAGTKGIGPLADGQAYAQSLGKGSQMSSEMSAALNDKDGISSYMSKFSSGDRQRAANRAFLDNPDSMMALRDKEAMNGVVYANQKHYIAGSDADGPAQAITRSQARDISSGKTTADALLQTYKNSIVKSGSETPAELQDPAIAGKEFRTDSGITASDPVSQASALESKDFSLNNDDGGGFSAPKGYKAQSSYKDPAFPNPFKK